MAEGAAGSYPQVFVVDSQASYAPLPSGRTAMRAKIGQRLLLFLVGLALFGVVVEGFIICYLYNKTENMWAQSSHQLGAMKGRKGPEETNDIPPIATGRPHPVPWKKTPSAHLMGSRDPVGANGVIQWVDTQGDAFTNLMDYKNGCLVVREEGYYYLYSKVHLNAAEECSVVKHKVMKDTKAYDESLELMSSNRFRCRRASGDKDQRTAINDDLRNSFLGGVFHLQPGDKVFVTLQDGRKIRLGNTDNFMGAFMI
ncbi:tumor necrosis factor ligand superfamily member 14-like [Polymixia lowei]